MSGLILRGWNPQFFRHSDQLGHGAGAHFPDVRGRLQKVRARQQRPVEQAFRRHAAILDEQATPPGQRHIAVDGKALRQSFDAFQDRKAAHILSAFASASTSVLAHLDCDEKSNEIPAVQALLRQLGLEQALLTVDAMHCQKNI